MARAVEVFLMYIFVHCENRFPLFVDHILSRSALVSRNVSVWVGTTHATARQLQFQPKGYD